MIWILAYLALMGIGTASLFLLSPIATRNTIYGLMKRPMPKKSGDDARSYEECRSSYKDNENESRFSIALFFSLIVDTLTFMAGALWLNTPLLYMSIEVFLFSIFFSTFTKTFSWKVILVLLLLISSSSIATAFVFAWNGPVANGVYIGNQMTAQPYSSLFSGTAFPFSKLPIVSQDFARFIATSHIADFGGSTQILDYEQIVHNGYPYWIFAVGPTNTWAQTSTLGYILVNAVNGSYKEVVQQSQIAPGFYWNHDIDWVGYINSITDAVGNHYPQPVGNKILYVFTYNSPQVSGAMQYDGGIVYNPDGSINATWSGLNAPAYVNQPWDRFLVEQLAADWGSTRTAPNGNGYFAGGFVNIPASAYRLTISNDTQLIPYGTETGQMMFFTPANAPNSLYGVMVVTGTHAYYYDFHTQNFVSPASAKRTIAGTLQKPSTGSYVPSNPILYPINKEFVWVIPYFYENGGTTQLKGIGIVDAQNNGRVANAYSPTPVLDPVDVENLKNSAITQFEQISSTGPLSTTTTVSTVTGSVQDVKSWVQNGYTHVALEVNGTYYDVSSQNLSFAQWVYVLNVRVGQTVTMSVQGQEVLKIGGS